MARLGKAKIFMHRLASGTRKETKLTTIDQDDRVRNLEAFANNAAPVQNLPSAPSVANIGAERIVGAQQVAVYRDEIRILQKLTALGAQVGSNWLYRFPVKSNGATS